MATIAEAEGHPDVSKDLATLCVYFARKIRTTPSINLSSKDTDR